MSDPQTAMKEINLAHILIWANFRKIYNIYVTVNQLEIFI